MADRQASTEQASWAPHLFGLPQELRDIIFKYAYYEVPRQKLISRHSWYTREIRRRRDATTYHAIRPYPAPKVSEFLISKRFFVAAARAWIKNRRFSSGFYFCLHDLIEGRGIVVEFAEECEMVAGDFICGLRNLKKITLHLDEYDFKGDGMDSVFEHQFTAAELFSLPVCKDVQDVRGVQQLVIELWDPIETHSQSELDVWTSNVQALEDMIRSLVTRSDLETTSTVPASDQDIKALYAGSEVCFGTSYLQPTTRSASLPRHSAPVSATSDLSPREFVAGTLDALQKATRALKADHPWLPIYASNHSLPGSPSLSMAETHRKHLLLHVLRDLLPKHQRAFKSHVTRQMLRNRDILVTLEAFYATLLKDGDAIMSWILKMKPKAEQQTRRGWRMTMMKKEEARRNSLRSPGHR